MYQGTSKYNTLIHVQDGTPKVKRLVAYSMYMQTHTQTHDRTHTHAAFIMNRDWPITLIFLPIMLSSYAAVLKFFDLLCSCKRIVLKI